MPLRLLAALALVCAASAAAAQPREGIHAVGSAVSELLVRQEAAGRLPGGSTFAQPLAAREASRLLDSLTLRADELSAYDRELLARARGEGARPFGGRLGRVFADGAVAARVEGDGYAVEVSPLLDVAAGPARRTETPERTPSALVYQARRGIRAGGQLGRHLFFETRAVLNGRQPALLTFDADGTAPRLGFVKRPGNGDLLEYFTAEGSVGYRDRFVEVRFGRDRHRWGAGQNSLFLTDYAAPMDALQFRASAGPFRYTSLFSRRTIPDRFFGDSVLPSAYAAMHRFGVSLGRVDLEFFEAVAFADDTLRNARSGFEIAYLNPVIFYRSVESELGSGDNAMVGAALTVRPARGVSVYGQAILDEFTARFFFDDYWGNKWGLLGGVHTVDVGLPGLEVRAEAARIRPYVYGHRIERTAFVHFRDGLGHVAGPNAVDLSLFARYRPAPGLEAALSAARTVRGRDPDGTVVGGNPRAPYTARDPALDLATPTLVGVRQTEWLAEGRLALEVLPDVWAEGALVGQSLVDAERGATRALAATLGLRWGLPFRSERW